MRRPAITLMLVTLLGLASLPAEARRKKPATMEDGIKLDKETEDLIRQQREQAEGKTPKKDEEKKEEKKPEKKAEKKEEKKPEKKKMQVKEVPEEKEAPKKDPPKMACDCAQFSCTAPDGMRSMTGPCHVKCSEGQAADCQCGACGEDGHVGNRNMCTCK